MNVKFLSAWIFLGFLGVQGVVAAQESFSATVKSFDAVAKETQLKSRLVELESQLRSTESEMRRRLECQLKMQVSTPLGCQDIPGYPEFVASRVVRVTPTLPAELPSCEEVYDPLRCPGRVSIETGRPI